MASKGACRGLEATSMGPGSVTRGKSRSRGLAKAVDCWSESQLACGIEPGARPK